MKTEIKKILYRFLQDGISSDEAAQQVLDLFPVSSRCTSWLEDRITKTKIEKDNAEELNLKISKGGKLCAYKQVLNYIRKYT